MRLPGQAVRFVLVGTGGTGAYAVLFQGASRWLPTPLALCLSWLVSTLATNAVHRRLTFGVRRREGRGADAIVFFGTSLLGLGLTQLLVAGAAATPGLQVLLIGAGTGAAGTLRFVLMRLWLTRTPPSQATHSKDTLHPLPGATESGA
ncbi:hypothetical protein HJ590_06760 [Naumannella sp. ID2617S]|nr:hypothetical protein [Naumannella sp. ID2617S]